MNTDCWGIELFSAKERKNWWKKKWKTDVYGQNEIFVHWFPSLSAGRKKSNFRKYSSLELFYVMALDQKREKVKHRMIFFFVPGATSHCQKAT